jgi:hypothetical protein
MNKVILIHVDLEKDDLSVSCSHLKIIVDIEKETSLPSNATT